MAGQRKQRQHNELLAKLAVRSMERIGNPALQASPNFDRYIVTLAQDLAYHHVTHIGLCGVGAQDMTGAAPCRVLRAKKRDITIVVGGLTSFFVSRTVDPNQSSWCQVLAGAVKHEALEQLERRWLLSFAPNYCHSGSDGAALLKRIWKACTASERFEIYGVTTFADFTRRVNLTIRRQGKAPVASTRAYYAPQDQMQFPEF